MTEELLSRSFALHGRDFDKAGETSTEIKAMLKELGIDSRSSAGSSSSASRPR